MITATNETIILLKPYKAMIMITTRWKRSSHAYVLWREHASFNLLRI